MPFTYQKLTAQQQAEMVGNHLLQAEADHFAATLNAEKAEAAALAETDADRKASFTAAAVSYRDAAKRIEGDIAVLKKRAGAK